MNDDYFNSFSNKYIGFETTEIYHGLGIPITMNYSKNLFEGNALCVGDTDGFLSLYSISHSEIINTENTGARHSKIYSIRLHDGSITDVKFQNISMESGLIERYIFVSSTDSFLTKFDIEHEKESCKLKAHKEWIKRFALSSEYFSLIATVGNDGSLHIYDDRQFHCKSVICLKQNTLVNIDLSREVKKRNHIDEHSYKNIERVYLVPRIELNRIHELSNRTNSIRKSVNREKLISCKKMSVSGVVFLSSQNYIATSGSSDSSVKIWDIRKLSNSSEDNYVNRFTPQLKEDNIEKDDLRGIIWMDTDDYYNKLAIQTRRGVISIYSISDILSCNKNLKPLKIDMSRISFEEDRSLISEDELIDFNQRPALSSCGDWLATPSNSATKIYVFKTSDFTERPKPYFAYKNYEGNIFPEFQCIAWKKKFNTENLSHGLPPKDWNELGEESYVGKDYCSNFSVGTKLKYLKIFDNKRFQVKFRGSAMPDFLDVSPGGVQSKSDDIDDSGDKLKSQWVSGEALSFNSSFDGDLEAVNQLSLSSSLSIPIPKPSRGSVADENADIPIKDNTDCELGNLVARNSENSPREKTGFLTLGNLGFGEKECQSTLDNLYVSNTNENFEKTPFRRSIPFLGSSQDSVGYPAPQRRQCGYIVQSQESLFTPKSPEKKNFCMKGIIDTERDDQSYLVDSSGSKEYSARKIIHIPLSQSNEEVFASPSINSNDEFLDKYETEYSKNDNDSAVSQKNTSIKNDVNSEDECKGFKQRRLDSWIRIKKNVENSTTNCSTAELSPIN